MYTHVYGIHLPMYAHARCTDPVYALIALTCIQLHAGRSAIYV